MQDDLGQINRKMQDLLRDLQEYATGKMSDSVKNSLDPMIQNLLQNMGIDFSQLRGMAAGQASYDPYKVVGLDRSASDDEVKKRYRELMYLLHPDTAGVRGTEDLFKTVMAAFDVIKRERGW